MKIAIVTHYFPPEIGAPQARLSDFARMWAQEGHEVVVLTGMPNHPTGVVPDRYRRRITATEEVDGYTVARCWLYATPNEGFLRKTLGHLSFMASSVLLGWRRIGRPDVIVVSSPTFFSIASAWLLSRVKRTKLVVEVRDLWPAIFVELGVLTNKRIIRLLEWLELAAYRSADLVVVVSEGFRHHITNRGIPEQKVVTIRNGVDLDTFLPIESPNRAARRALGAADADTLVLYLGAHGISQGLRTVVEAAALLVGQPIHFALVGEGADKAAVVAMVTELGLPNVTCLPGVPREAVPSTIGASDICLVPLRGIPLFTTFIPSKIFEFLAAGRPIVGSVAGEPAEILREAGAVVVAPERPRELADAILRLANQPLLRQEMASLGRTYVTREFDRRRLARQYLDHLGTVCTTR